MNKEHKIFTAILVLLLVAVAFLAWYYDEEQLKQNMDVYTVPRDEMIWKAHSDNISLDAEGNVGNINEKIIYISGSAKFEVFDDGHYELSNTNIVCKFNVNNSSYYSCILRKVK